MANSTDRPGEGKELSVHLYSAAPRDETALPVRLGIEARMGTHNYLPVNEILKWDDKFHLHFKIKPSSH